MFGATGYDTNKKLVGYGVVFGTQKYAHDDGKKARNLVILGTNSNALVLEKGNIKITTNDKYCCSSQKQIKNKLYNT